jgi:RsiW-degrading membrane proteinase PrsW (M82 family)
MVAPLLLSLPLMKSSSRRVMIYILIGVCVSLFVSEINSRLLSAFNNDMLFVTTTLTPVTEEIVKALPVLLFAFVFSDDREKLLPISFATGIGFALFENTVILVQNIDNVSILWAIIRGFSTALMHGICTALVGYGMGFVRKKKKLFVSGTFALLALAIIYNGLFNMLVESKNLQYVGFFMPAVTYIPLIIYLVFFARNKKKNNKTATSASQGLKTE